MRKIVHWMILLKLMIWYPMNNPHRGEIWIVDFNPTVGSEIQKQRTAVVVSLDTIGKLPLRIVVPITGWDAR